MEDLTNEVRGRAMPPDDAALRHMVRRRFVLGVVVALSGLGLSLLLYAETAKRDRQLAVARFDRDASLRVHAIERAVARRLVIVDMLAAFFTHAESVTEQEFHMFTQVVLAKHRGLHCLAWIPCVPAAQREAFERAIRKSGRPDYRISEEHSPTFTPAGELVPATPRSRYFPILYHEPTVPGYSLFGFDVRTIPAFRKAIDATTEGHSAGTVVCPPLEDHNPHARELYVLEAVGKGVGAGRRRAGTSRLGGRILQDRPHCR